MGSLYGSMNGLHRTGSSIHTMLFVIVYPVVAVSCISVWERGVHGVCMGLAMHVSGTVPVAFVPLPYHRDQYLMFSEHMVCRVKCVILVSLSSICCDKKAR